VIGLPMTRLLAAAACALLVAGCGNDSRSPFRPAAPSLPVLVVGEDGNAGFVQASWLSDAGTSRALRVSKEVYGAKGGWVRCGRFLLTIPPGAFDSVATVTMSMPDTTAMVVDLEISPESRNQFAVPVVLACNTTRADVDPESVAIYWYDAAASKWVGMESDKNLVHATDCIDVLAESGEEVLDLSKETDGLTALLSHFSKYSAGKAGW